MAYKNLVTCSPLVTIILSFLINDKIETFIYQLDSLTPQDKTLQSSSISHISVNRKNWNYTKWIQRSQSDIETNHGPWMSILIAHNDVLLQNVWFLDFSEIVLIESRSVILLW